MRLITKTAAALTVVCAVALAPVFSRRTATHEPATQLPVVRAPRHLDPPSGWPAGVFQHLRERRMPIEVSDLQGLIHLVETTSGRFHVDPLMVLAVIHVESGFNPYAISSAGSV